MKLLGHLYNRFETYLQGQTNEYLTWLLILTAFVLLVIAWRGSPAAKVVTLAWVIFP